MPVFYVDFDCIGATYMRSVTIAPTCRRDGYYISVRRPPDWKEICFKRLSPVEYNQEVLDWKEEDDDDVDQDEWLNCMCSIIDRERDILYVNHNRKQAILDRSGASPRSIEPSRKSQAAQHDGLTENCRRSMAVIDGDRHLCRRTIESFFMRIVMTIHEPK